MGREKNFDSILYYLPKELGRSLSDFPEEMRAQTTEIRMRAGKPLMLCGAYGCCFPYGNGRYSFMSFEKTPIVTAGDVEYVAVALCGRSVYAHQDEINSGYISFGDGCRAGISGMAVTEDGKIKNVRSFSSINIRIAKNIRGSGRVIAEKLYANGLCNTVIFGAPHTGKTTVLKELASIVSSAPWFYRTAVADERCELAACDGVNLDLFCGYPKAKAIEQAVRAFSPDVIIADEIATRTECEAVLAAMDCGVRLITSVHCGSVEEFLRRPVCRSLIGSGTFAQFVYIAQLGKSPEFYTREELYAEMHGNAYDPCSVFVPRDALQCRNERSNIGA